MTNSTTCEYVAVGYFFTAATRSEQPLKLTYTCTHPSRSRGSAAKKIQDSRANPTGCASKFVNVHIINLDLKLQSDGTLVTNF